MADASARAAELSEAARKTSVKEAKKLGVSEKDLAVIEDHLRRAETTVNFDASKVIGKTPLPELLAAKGATEVRGTEPDDLIDGRC